MQGEKSSSDWLTIGHRCASFHEFLISGNEDVKVGKRYALIVRVVYPTKI
jgi:hypothetical protein